MNQVVVLPSGPDHPALLAPIPIPKPKPINYALSSAILGAWGGRPIPPEQPLIDWATQLCPKGKQFVDVGAHCGTWSLWFAAQGFDVAAFEPQAGTFELLRAATLLNTFGNRIWARNDALGAFTRIVDLRIISADGGGTSYIPLSTHEKPIATERVNCNALDDYREELFNNIGLIKIDVEGAELDVLKGAVKTLERNGYPPIIFESWGFARMPEASCLRLDLFTFLGTLGYRVISINGFDEIFLAEYPK
jgi:FkbM family methyltransferase